MTRSSRPALTDHVSPTYPPLTAGRTWTTDPGATAVARSAGSPSTKTLMCGRSRGPASTKRSRIPGTDASSPEMSSPTVAPVTSFRFSTPGNSASSDRGRRTVAKRSGLDDDRLDAPDLGQRVGDHPPAPALV